MLVFLLQTKFKIVARICAAWVGTQTNESLSKLQQANTFNVRSVWKHVNWL